MMRKALLVCGILSSLLYAAMMMIVGPMRWEGYSLVSHTVSELGAIGAPSRPVLIPLGIAYQVLITAFGVGVWTSAAQNRSLRIAGCFLVAYGLIGFTAPFASVHLRGQPGSLSDTLHIILTAVTVVFMLLSVGFAAAALGTRFRLYSIVTLLVVLAFGAWAGLDGPRIVANLPTPWVGLKERICIGGFLLWVVVLAVRLLRAQGAGGPSELRKPRMMIPQGA